jgi:hypothetical protein
MPLIFPSTALVPRLDSSLVCTQCNIANERPNVATLTEGVRAATETFVFKYRAALNSIDCTAQQANDVSNCNEELSKAKEGVAQFSSFAYKTLAEMDKLICITDILPLSNLTCPFNGTMLPQEETDDGELGLLQGTHRLMKDACPYNATTNITEGKL